jgi:hypothetical protein
MDLLQGQYMNTVRAYAHAGFHLDHRHDPDLGSPYGEASRLFLKADEQAKENIAMFIEFAQGKAPAEMGIDVT